MVPSLPEASAPWRMTSNPRRCSAYIRYWSSSSRAMFLATVVSVLSPFLRPSVSAASQDASFTAFPGRASKRSRRFISVCHAQHDLPPVVSTQAAFKGGARLREGKRRLDDHPERSRLDQARDLDQLRPVRLHDELHAAHLVSRRLL